MQLSANAYAGLGITLAAVFGFLRFGWLFNGIGPVVGADPAKAGALAWLLIAAFGFGMVRGGPVSGLKVTAVAGAIVAVADLAGLLH